MKYFEDMTPSKKAAIRGKFSKALARFWSRRMPFPASFAGVGVSVIGWYAPGEPGDGGTPPEPGGSDLVRIEYTSGPEAGSGAATFPSSLRTPGGRRLFPRTPPLRPRSCGFLQNPSKLPKGCQPLRERRQEAAADGMAFDPFIGAPVPRRPGRGRPAAYLTPETRALAQRLAQVEHLIGEVVWKYGMSEEAVKCLRSDLMGVANLLNEARGRRKELSLQGRWPPSAKTYQPPKRRGRPKKRAT